MQITYSSSDIKIIDNYFSEKQYKIIEGYVNSNRWCFGHGSYPMDHPDYEKSRPFWRMDLDSYSFFTESLLNTIRMNNNLNYSLYDVYANGHTYGTYGSKHVDWNDEHGKTLLLYVNDEWECYWGGKTAFYFNDETFHVMPKRNRAVLFPGQIPHNAEPTTELFKNLRITIAWKLYNHEKYTV